MLVPMRARAATAVIATALSCFACRSAATPESVLLITLDTLRADHLGSYGYAAGHTPYLDALAVRGLRFAEATTVTPLTLPAHSSLLTGTFPAHHGVRDNGGFYLAEEERTLAEVLRARGWRTGAFVGAFVLDSRFGLAQGFDHYFDDFDLSRFEGKGMDSVQRRGDEVVEKALAWIAEDRRRPFFAWVHLYDPHTPYDAPEPFRSRYPDTVTGAYDAEVDWTDALVGRLLAGLEAEGRFDRTVIVALGDHGESLGEHGEATHGFFIYDATVHIPLIVAGPGIPSRVVADQVRIVDVMPTVLDLLALPGEPSVQGRSLLPLLRGERLGLVAFSESFYPRYHYGWSELMSLRDGRYKFIRAPRPELYDLGRDAAETHDLAGAEPERTRGFESALTETLERLGSGHAPAPRAVDAETAERLQALGYVSSGPSPRHLEERPRGDPKDKIGLYNLLKEAGAAAIDGRREDAVALAEEAVRADPGVVEGHALLGSLHTKAGRYERAVAAYRRALALDPENQTATFGLALAYKEMGRMEDAEAGFERARRLDPKPGRTYWQLADIAMRRGRLEAAEALLKQALALEVDRPTYLQKLGECYLEMKRYAEAEALLREALGLRPDLAAAHYDLALVHEARGETDKAVAEYAAELKRDAKAYRSAFNVGLLLLRAGRAAEAALRFRQSLDVQADFGTGWLYLAKALLDSGDVEGAREAALRGLQLRPEARLLPLGHYVLADVYAREGRPREAEREAALARRLERGS